MLFVLVAGGFQRTADGITVLSSAEIYDPLADAWTRTAPLHESRYDHAATLLSDGAVMIVGGENDAGPDGRAQILSSAEIYDPEHAVWSSAGRMARTRRDHTATALTDGAVLVTGGLGGISEFGGYACRRDRAAKRVNVSRQKKQPSEALA